MNAEYICLQILFSFLSIFAFAIMLSAPTRELIPCGLCGGFTWGIYLLCDAIGYSDAISTLAASFSLTLLTRTMSIIRKTPVTIYMTTGVLPLVPGTGIYYTSYYFMMNDTATAGAECLTTFKTAGAIALGIIFGFAVPIHSKKKLHASQ